MPAGGFGNLIALPLQSRPRETGNSVFLDDDLRPYEDQWGHLSTVGRLSRGELISIVSKAAAVGQIIGVRFPVRSRSCWATKSISTERSARRPSRTASYGWPHSRTPNSMQHRLSVCQT
jgi:hypothetical protein